MITKIRQTISTTTTLFIILISFFTILSGEDIYIPNSLKEWKEWVLYDNGDALCPKLHSNSSKKKCIWYENIKFQPKSGVVEIDIVNFDRRDKFVPLVVGDSGWIENLYLDENLSPILERKNRPYTIIESGKHHLKFRVVPENGLKYLKLPKSVVAVDVDGVGVVQSSREHRVWLTDRREKVSKKDSLDLSIYRKIKDGHPIKVETYLHFRVSGKMRYINLKGILLDDFLPVNVFGGLKAIITKERDVKVELKAGEWSLNIVSYSTKDIATIKKPKYNIDFSNDEVWVFEANPSFRSVKIEGATPIDPTQTAMPNSWKRASAYLIKDKIVIKKLYSSRDVEKNNHFNLKREVWLDFDGRGYSLFDEIDGKISKISRLESIGEFNLLSASINGVPQVITTLKSGGREGVELREKSSLITTSARIDGNISTIPINGWSHKMDSVELTLNLPPAWRVLASNGSDWHSDLWIEHWNLFEIFILLLLTTMVFKLFDFKTALGVFIFGIIFWQEKDAPTTIWIAVALSVALLRVLPEGKIRKVSKIFIAVLMLKLLFIIFMFGTAQLRSALYPQLEKLKGESYYFSVAPTLSASREEADASLKESKSIRVREEKYEIDSFMSMSNSMMKKSAPIKEKRVDINEIAQTGIAKPSWRWSEYRFGWRASVGEREKLKVYLVAPEITRVWRVLSLFGVLFVLSIFIREIVSSLNFPKFSKTNLKIPIFATVLIGLATPNIAYSEIPSDKLLKELKLRVIKKPVCKNSCASIEKISMSVEDKTLSLYMVISSGDSVYIPSLESLDGWIASKATIDNNGTLLRGVSSDGKIYIQIPKGVHRVHLEGNIPEGEESLLESKLPFRNIDINSSRKWKVDSNGKHYIRIKPVKSGDEGKETKSSISPLISIKRYFSFKNRWYINTEVRVLNMIPKPKLLKYPLIEGESILNQNIKVESRKAVFYLSNENPLIVWNSSLPISEEVNLTALLGDLVEEEWLIDVDYGWNISYKGLSPTKSLIKNNRLIEKFLPWQGESLNIRVEQTVPEDGNRLTIESSYLNIEQSQNYRDLELTLQIKSAMASKYTLSIENLEELKGVVIDGIKHYLKHKDGNLTFPLKAGSQNIKISWREKSSVSILYHFPTINLNEKSTNSTVKVSLPENRWVIFTAGALMAPAVLIWGVMLFIILFGFLANRFLGSPPTFTEWILLGVGVAMVSPTALIPILFWAGILKFKVYKGETLQGLRKNIVQSGIVIFTIFSIAAILFSIFFGLLSTPDMMIKGNGSSSYYLIWYKDYIDERIFQPTLFTLSIWYYKVLMLIWSIWVSFVLISWIENAWTVFSKGTELNRKER